MYHRVYKCRTVTEAICFAFLERDQKTQFNKGIDPITAYQIDQLLEWIENYLRTEEFSYFFCPMRRFKELLRKVRSNKSFAKLINTLI